MDISLFELNIFLPFIYLYGLVIGAFIVSLLWGGFLSDNSELLIGTESIPHQQFIDKICFGVVAFAVFLFMATRDESVGSDTSSYIDFFNSDDFSYMGDKTEFLFELHGRLLRLFHLNDEAFVFVTTLIYSSGLYYLIWKTSKFRTFSLILFMIIGTSSIFFFLYLSMMRQCLALCFFFYAVYFLFESDRSQNGKLFLGALFYISAILTHASCLFTLPFIILTYLNKTLSKKIWIIVLVVTYLMAALDISFVSQILGFVMGIVQNEHYEQYADVHFGMIDSKGMFNMNLIPFMVLAAIILLIASSDEIKDYKIQFALLSVVLNNIFFDNLMWSRLIMYFSMFMIIAIPNAIYGKTKMFQIPIMSFVFVYFSYKTFSQLLYQILYFDDGNIIIPYESWLIDFGYE